ncbi:MAG TPA: hypothetical protein VHQ90_16780 [Thermoanaerobaculia bacterium]|nr:hypothetical protein [Thermoanaerobaculia bacterium]
MKIAKSVALGLTCVLAAAGAAQAQSKPKQFVQLLTIHAKPDGAVDFEAFVKKVNAAAERVGQNQRTVLYQVAAGGPGYTYMIATYFDKWAENDAVLSVPEILMKALGDVEGGKALRAGRASIASTEAVVYRLLPDLSTKIKAYDPPPAYLQVFRNEVKPAMTREWERVIGRYKAASEQMAESPTSIRRVSVEGPSNVYITSSPYANGAERDAWPSFLDVLKKAYGDDEARALDQSRLDSIERSEAFILKFRPDLSRLGK